MVRTALAGVWATCVCATLVAAPAAAADDIVLYANDATNLHGNWARGADSSAAGGYFLASIDKGFTAGGALATPADYFDFTFNAPANTPFRIWFRLRAQSNSKYNDSIYAQFSDAIDAAGAPMHRMGTGSALTVNLQSCDGCMLAGWGWLDGAYWLTQASTVRF